MMCLVVAGLLWADTVVTVADNQSIRFSPDSPPPAPPAGQILDHGRVLLRTLHLPASDRHVQATARITLRSAGDPWDKLGTLFLLPADGSPAVELLRFITPFGVGHFSDHPKTAALRPAYVPHWADSVTWEADLSDYAPLLRGDVTLGLHIDTWSAEGYTVSATLELAPSPHACIPPATHAVTSLFNTTPLLPGKEAFTAFADGPVDIPWNVPSALSDPVLLVTTTGHGGHAEGDEFTPREHVVRLDGREIARWTPWRDDCASFRRLNPSSGVWTEDVVWKGDTLPERIASSDYSRSGWCPGAAVEPVRIAPGPVAGGPHVLTLEIVGAQPYREGEQNFWNVGVVGVGD
jgi:hypothetical protein